MTAAESEGRVIKKIALAEIETHHLARDRVVLDEADMETLTASIAERGQQSPVEVLRLPSGRYGLISGLRRVNALSRLNHVDVLALVRRPETSQEAYRAMIEENEIRVGLSFFERAQVALEAVGQGVYPSVRTAVAGLFTHAAPAKRSKISKFVTICEALGDDLHFPTAISEKAGLALAQAIEADPRVARKLIAALKRKPPVDAAEERRQIDAVLKTAPAGKTKPEELMPGLTLAAKTGRVVLSGPKVDAAFLDDMRAWLAARDT